MHWHLRTIALSLVAALLFATVACSDDDNGNGESVDPALFGVWLNHSTGESWTINEDGTYEVARGEDTGTFVPGDSTTPDRINNLYGDNWESTEAQGNGLIEVGDVFDNLDNSRRSLHIVSDTLLGVRTMHETNPTVYEEQRRPWEFDGTTTIIIGRGHAGTYAGTEERVHFYPEWLTEVVQLEIDGNELYTPEPVLTSAVSNPESITEGSPWSAVDEGEISGVTYYFHFVATISSGELEFAMTVSSSSDIADGIVGSKERQGVEEVADEMLKMRIFDRFSYDVDGTAPFSATLSTWNVAGDIGMWSSMVEEAGTYTVYVGHGTMTVGPLGTPFESSSPTLVGGEWGNSAGDEMEFYDDGTYTITQGGASGQVIDEGHWREDANGRIYWSSTTTYTKQAD